MIENLISFLGTEIELNAEEVSDILWLILERQKRSSSPIITPSEDLQKDKTEEKSDRVKQRKNFFFRIVNNLSQLPLHFLSIVINNLSQLAHRFLSIVNNLSQLTLCFLSKGKKQQSPPPQKESKTSSPSATVDVYTGKQGESQTSIPENYIPLAVPDPRTINNPLKLLQALKPLLKMVPSDTEEIINESATADWIAQTQLWQVITEPDLERWLELVLIVDESVSMVLWRRTVQELEEFFQHYGIFRNVRVWGIGLNDKQNLYLRSPLRNHQPRELIDLQGRRLIFLISDFVDRLWYQEPILQILEEWSNSNPVAVLQMLPEWLWSGSALSIHTPALLTNSEGNTINRNFNALVNRLYQRRGLDQGIRLPVFSLEEDLFTSELKQINCWSRMLAGSEDTGAIGYVLRKDLLKQERGETSKPTAQQRVDGFRENASPLARQLAGLLASAPVITMPVVRLIQESMLTESGQIHRAEVFLGGLLTPTVPITPETDPELLYYDFIPDVRNQLSKFVAIPERDEVIDRVSRYVAQGLGVSLREFIGYIKDSNKLKGENEISSIIKPFARITKEILGQSNESEIEQSTEVIENEGNISKTSPESMPSAAISLPSRTEEIEIATVKVLRGGEEELFKQLRSRVDQSVMSNSQLYQRMFEQIALLPEEYRIPLEMKYFEGVGDREIVLRMKIYREELDRRINSAINLLISQFFVPQDLLLFESETVFVDRTGTIVERKLVQAYYNSVNIYNSINLDMVYIPGGKFIMGSSTDEKGNNYDERPQHLVNVPSFYMSKYPITQGQWKAISSRTDLRVNRYLTPEPSRFKVDNRPVERVSWYDAVEFCARLSQLTGQKYRLPTEAEWEYACRAVANEQLSVGSEESEINQIIYPPFHFGETITSDLANYSGATYADEPEGIYREQITPVVMFPPNALGLYDMHGNVREWCEDDWHEDYTNAPTDGSAWIDKSNKRNLSVVRGGSWFYYPNLCRSANRHPLNRRVYNDFDFVGFRVVCDSSVNS